MAIVLPLWDRLYPEQALYAAENKMENQELAELYRGGVVVSTSPAAENREAMIRAAILIEAPAEKIWAVMNDCDQAPQFVPGLEACRVLSRDAEGEVVQHWVRYSWILPEITYTFQARFERFRKISFQRISGDLKEFKGSWSLDPLEGGQKTIVAYSVFMDPGFFIPRRLTRYLLSRNLPEFMTALRDRVMALSP